MSTTIRQGQRTPSGRPFYLAVRDAEGDLEVFDSPADVVASLEPSYPDEAAKGQVAAYMARHGLARRLIIAATEASCAGRRVNLMPDDARWALSARGARAVTDVKAWNYDFPLYILGTFHSPYTDVPLPEGNVIIINPATEADLVASVADAGLVDAVDIGSGVVWRG
jgi:hypothetical protein